MYGSDMIPKHSESSRFLRVLMGVAEQRPSSTLSFPPMRVPVVQSLLQYCDQAYLSSSRFVQLVPSLRVLPVKHPPFAHVPVQFAVHVNDQV